MSKFKKVIRAGIFLAIVGYLIIHLTYVLRPNISEKQNLMGFYAEEENSLDVVFIGSSSLWTSVNPLTIWSQKGIASYVIATSAQRPSSLLYLLREAVKYQKNAVYFLDISTLKYEEELWKQQNEGSLRRVTDGLKYSWNRIQCNWEQTKGKEDRLSYFFDIIKYHSEWKNLYSNLSHWNFKLENKYKGYMLKDVFEPVVDTWKVEEVRPISSEAETVLKRLLNYCKEKQLPVEFTLAVSTGTSYGMSQYLKKIVESYGFELLIFNEYTKEMGINYSYDFMDAGHLNVGGAEKATTFLANYIAEKYQIKDKRKETEYKSWNLYAEQMKEKVNEAVQKIIENSEWYIGAVKVAHEVINGNTILWKNQTESPASLEYAWYVYESTNNGFERIETQWYRKEADFSYVFEPGKKYQITSFVRCIEKTEIVKYKVVAEVWYDTTQAQWIIQPSN